MPCALCQQNKPLRNSHIVPEFMYGDFYDPKHRFHVHSTDLKQLPIQHQKGLRVEMLCDTCEGKFSRYENYAASKFYRPAVAVMKANPSFLRLPLEYPLFKLFMLSLLWRFGNAGHKDFPQTDLAGYSEKLRSMLLNEDPGGPLDFPWMINALTLNGKFHADVTTPAFVGEYEGLPVREYLLSGFDFRFFLSTAPGDVPPTPGHLLSNGELVIGIYEMRRMPDLYNLVCDIGAANRARKAAAAR